jgi:hypothetical protein
VSDPSDGGAPGGPKRPRVELNLDADTARGRYANATVVTRGRHEVVLDFIAALPHHRPQVVSRVVLPRAQAEALALTLRRTLDADAAAPTAAAPRGDDDPN